MKRRLALAPVVVLMAVCAAGAVLAGANLGSVFGRYPDAVLLSGDQISWAGVRDGTISRQGVYYTPDPLQTVRHWYVDRMGTDETLDKNPAGECVWLQQTTLMVRLEHSLSVMMCAQPNGTKVVVNEGLRLWR